MAWAVEYDPRAVRDLKKLDRSVQREILDYMDDRIATAEDPRQFGKPLRGSKVGLWRYRVRDYRIICEIQEKRVVVLVVAVGHRSTIYNEVKSAPRAGRQPRSPQRSVLLATASSPFESTVGLRKAHGQDSTDRGYRLQITFERNS